MPVRPQRSTRMLLSIALTTVAVAGQLDDAPPVDAAVAVRSATANLVLPCGTSTTVLADWYFPAVTSPTGVVWVQHGFTRSRTNIAALARSIAATTSAIVVAPSISSNFLSLNGCWINGSSMHRAVARMFGDQFSALQASATSAARTAGAGRVTLPRRFVLTGHSAGGNLATAAAGETTRLTSGGASVAVNLAGVVMYDGVDSGGAIRTGLSRLVGAFDRPVWTIAAPDSSCNASGSGTDALVAARPGRFVGVLVTQGSHNDAEGTASTGCGTVLARNVAALRTLASDWIGALLAGTPTSARLATTSSGTVSPVGDASVITL